jgi:hypothetical protein
MGMVVPANKIVDLVKNHPALKEDRRVRAQAARDAGVATADSAIVPPVSTTRTSGDNPNHLEDFTRLVGVATPEKLDR